MEYPFIIDLCESQLIPSQSSLKHWKITKLSELCYLYLIGLHILLRNPTTKEWAKKYCETAGEQNDFKSWRSNGNDLYVMLFALTADDEETKSLAISPSIIRHWLRHSAVKDDKDETHSLLMRLDGMFHIGNSSMKAIRRTTTYWKDVDKRERNDVVIKIIQMIHDRAPSNSEILPQLKKIPNETNESATAGATGAANVAAVVGGLGAGFDPDGDRGIYAKKKVKPLIIRR